MAKTNNIAHSSILPFILLQVTVNIKCIQVRGINNLLPASHLLQLLCIVHPHLAHISAARLELILHGIVLNKQTSCRTHTNPQRNQKETYSIYTPTEVKIFLATYLHVDLCNLLRSTQPPGLVLFYSNGRILLIRQK